MLSTIAFLQMGLFLLVVLLFTKPLGIYLSKVLNPQENTFLDPVIKPIENATYKLLKIDPQKEQSWVEYLFSLLLFCFGSLFITMLVLFLQPYLPFNPQNLSSLSWDLILNTAVSYMTNTNWQSYAGESTMSYFSQMMALTVQNFISPAVGISVSATLVRALTRNKSTTVGSFWVDLFRVCYYLLLPISIILAIIFIAEGVPQNFSEAIHAQTIEGASQVIAQGPVASQEAIKLLGSNGGGFFGANSAHPYENPTPLSNLIQMLAILLIPAAQIYYLGHEAKDKKHAWSIITTLSILLIAGAWFCTYSETFRTPLLTQHELYNGNMEGKEQRFGPSATAIYSSITTDTSCGAVNGCLDSMTPLGSLVPMVNMLFSEAIFGGCGSGLCSILIYVFIAIFFAGLIIGRTPEYLGKKIEAPEIKLTMLVLLTFGFVILSLTAWAVVSSWGIEGVKNRGIHGFSEIFYGYISTTANNGSAFAGLSANSPMYNVTFSIAMLAGRFGIIIPVLALAGSLAIKTKSPQNPNSLIVHGTVFTLFLLMIFLLFGALMFLPTLVMGPGFEEMYMYMGTLF